MNTKAIGKIIKELLDHSLMSQTDLAQKLKIAPPSLNQMLSGRVVLPKERLRAIIRILKPSQEIINQLNELYSQDEPISQTYSVKADLPEFSSINDEEYVLIKKKGAKPVVIPMKIKPSLIAIIRNIAKL